MSRLLGPLLLKNRRFWEWFVPKKFQCLHILFSGSLIWGTAFWVICPWNEFEETKQCASSCSLVHHLYMGSSPKGRVTLQQSHFRKMKLWRVEHFYNIFVLTFGRDCYCIQQSRPKLRTNMLWKCSTRQSFVFPKWLCYKIHTFAGISEGARWISK